MTNWLWVLPLPFPNLGADDRWLQEAPSQIQVFVFCAHLFTLLNAVSLVREGMHNIELRTKGNMIAEIPKTTNRGAWLIKGKLFWQNLKDDLLKKCYLLDCENGNKVPNTHLYFSGPRLLSGVNIIYCLHPGARMWPFFGVCQGMTSLLSMCRSSVIPAHRICTVT